MSRFSILAPRLACIVLAVGLWVSPCLTAAARAEEEPPGAAASAHAEPNILEFKPSLSISTLIVFGLLFLVLWKFAWGPLSKALHDREERMHQAAIETERARTDAERLMAEHRALMEQANEQVRSILEDARKTAVATGEEIVKKAQAEGDATKQRAERDIATARDQALQEIWTQSANLAVNLAGKVLPRELNAEDHRRLIEMAMAELPAEPQANGRGDHRS